MRNAIETQRLGGAHRCAPPWSILTWHSYARYIEHRVKRCAYVLLNGNGNGMRAAVKSFEKISEIFEGRVQTPLQIPAQERSNPNVAKKYPPVQTDAPVHVDLLPGDNGAAMAPRHHSGGRIY